jgi:uncharacterized protein (DUF1697 family)
MATHVALLRGINVGGKNKVGMAELRELVGELGYTDVSTYIQSGNVLFTADKGTDCAAAGKAMSAAILDKTGVQSGVVVITSGELAEIHAASPFPGEANPKLVHAVVLSGPPGKELTAKLEAAVAASDAKGRRDRATVVGRTLYLHTPDGYGTSDLSAAVLRILGSPKAGVIGTARNFATMTKLLELCG